MMYVIGDLVVLFLRCFTARCVVGRQIRCLWSLSGRIPC